MRRFIATIVVVALLMSSLGAASACAEGIVLPAALTVIEEEAFFGTPALGRVTLPEGIREIRARAFADSGLTAIDLPASITYIAEDAFDGAPLSEVTAIPGTYAYDWAVAHGYIAPRTPLTATVACDVEAAHTGDTAVWTAKAQGGDGVYAYSFELYLDGERIGSREAGADDRFDVEFERVGVYHVVARVSDGVETVEVSGAPVEVTLAPPSVAGLEVKRSQVLTAQTQTWTVTPAGGVAPYGYRYELTRDGGILETQPFSASATYAYTFFTEGSYNLRVQVRDAEGTLSAEVDFPFEVSVQSAVMTGVVRIYIECDEDGNILTGDSNVGHYELEIKGEDPEISFDNHVFTNPVFSFGAGANSAGTVTVYDGDIVPRTGVQLYTFEFTTTAGSVAGMLYEKLRDIYLDTAGETQNGYGYVYSTSSGPFVTYDIRTNNCFTAVAMWSNWLGYGTLSNIVASSASYTDYVAWKMYDRYASAWTYQGYYSSSNGDDDGPEAAVEKVVALALGQVGKKYAAKGGYRAKAPSGFDCSGLTFWAYYWGAGVTLSDSARGQGSDSRFQKLTQRDELRRGDILCFTADDNVISHVGIYLGGTSFVHASESAGKVIISTFTNYWTRNLKWGYHVIG